LGGDPGGQELLSKPFRFGLQIRTGDAEELRAQARAAEAAGFDVIHTWDHVIDGWSPLAPLVSMADATSRLRVCPLVLNNDFHHPVHLAREIAAIDHLTGGRVELGLGAGHAQTEYAAIGQNFDSPSVRKARLAEAVEIIRKLLNGEEVSFEGEHYRLDRVRTMRSLQEHLPILVGVQGQMALAHAARHADIIGLTGLGRTLEDGQHHTVRWEAERLDRTVDHIRTNVGDRWPQLELNALIQQVIVTNDRMAAASEVAEQTPGLSPHDALSTPFLAIGSQEEIAEHLLECSRRWGISYFTVRDLDAFEPVIARVRDRDGAAP
jgi:probable F420-dependent oxidoreductase